ncbi:30S ribosomal protein S20 [Actinomycetospora sp. CA-053990]|uniref:30S ribosomal protein S20 n=1 Tax=Actinomycetospora sp. CA-053990 TaxID=3239891 RepID=UPI003D906AF8
MANIKQQVKRNRKNEEARQKNKAVKSRIKTAIRRYREATEAGDVDLAGERRREAGRLLDKAVSKGVIHKNQAANKKSRMAHRAERFTVDAKAGKTPA